MHMFMATLFHDVCTWCVLHDVCCTHFTLYSLQAQLTKECLAMPCVLAWPDLCGLSTIINISVAMDSSYPPLNSAIGAKVVVQVR